MVGLSKLESAARGKPPLLRAIVTINWGPSSNIQGTTLLPDTGDDDAFSLVWLSFSSRGGLTSNADLFLTLPDIAIVFFLLSRLLVRSNRWIGDVDDEQGVARRN